MIRVIIISFIVVLVAASVACSTTTTSSSTALTNTPRLSSAEKKKREQEAVETYVKLGMGYLGVGNRDGARLNLQKALEMDARSAPALNGMAMLYQVERENELAEEYYLKALKYDSDLTAARNNYAIFLLRAQRNEEAYRQLLQAAKDLEYARRARVYLTLGMAADRLGKADEAFAAWEKSVNIDPAMTPSYFQLAKVYFEKNNLPQAKRYLNEYEELAGPRAKGLWLGVRLEHAFGNRDGEASKGLALEKLFPYSQENLDYQEWKKSQ